MNTLKESWKEFRAKYYDYTISDSQWKNDFDSVENSIAEADSIVNSGTDLKAAHETLEGIRLGFMELRKRNNMDYYIDNLTDFHGSMEHIYHSADDADPASLTDADIDDLRSSLTDASEIWALITAAEFDNTVFKLSDKKLNDKDMYMKKEASALKNMEAALNSKDAEKIIKTSLAIKPAYAKFYSLFGDFSFLEK